MSRRAIAIVEPEAVEETASQFLLGPFVVNVNGLRVPDHEEVPFAEWERLGSRLSIMEKGVQFAVGDWLNEIEERFGEEAAQAVDASQWRESTVSNYRWVAKSVPKSVRMMDAGLSFKHHQVLARYPARTQKRWLKRAANDGDPWTVARLKAALLEGEDLPIVGWRLLVTCEDAQQRLDLKTQLEGRGFACREVDKRQRRRQEE